MCITWRGRTFALLLLLGLPACAGPAPKLFPPSPLEISTIGSGVERSYDLDRDGRPDAWEALSPAGRIDRIRWHDDASRSQNPRVVQLSDVPENDRRHLLIILDSIPFEMVRDLHRQGRFRLFYPPSRVISPFPVMTDPALAEFFGVSPCRGVESEHYDGRELTNGYFAYANERNTPWLAHVDYHLNPVAHGIAYLKPRAWFDHELRRIQELFTERDCSGFTAYCVGPSSLGANDGRDGHQVGLIRLDRFCQWIVHDTRGRARITLMSDHGHNLVRSRRIPLSKLLEQAGYRVTKKLRRPGEVVVPEFGIVTCAAIHTREPAAVAADVVGFEGIALAAYLDEDKVAVLDRTGRALISKVGDAFKYEPIDSDPLELRATLARLESSSSADADGFVTDQRLFQATTDHRYPDAIHRLWRAFHGLVENTPDVLVSVEDGYHCGSAFMTEAVDLAAAHGNLEQLSSSAFVMTMEGELPPVMRMVQLREELIRLGVPLE